MSKILSEFSNFPLVFGGASISGEGGGYGFGDITKDESINLLHQAYEKGIKIFDTAPIYGFCESERRIGEAFKKMRENVFIVSKSGVSWHDTKRVNMTNDPSETQKMLENSLRDLNSDYIDLYMIHWPDHNVDIRRPMEVLAKAKAQGKIKHIGLCNTYPEDFNKASEVEKIDVIQAQFNFLEKESESLLFPIVKDNDIEFMSWGTFDKGILTGRVKADRKFDASDCRSWAPWWKDMDKVTKFNIVEKIEPLIKDHGHTLVEFAVGYNLMFDELSHVICGMKNTKQLESTVAAFENLPSLELLKEINSLVYES